MIKNLFETDEKQPEETETESEEKTARDADFDKSFESLFSGIELPPSSLENLSEISEPADDELIVSEKPPEIIAEEKTGGEPYDFSEPRFYQSENSFAETAKQSPLVEEKAAETPRESDELVYGFPTDETDFRLLAETTPIEKPDVLFPPEISNEAAAGESLDETRNYVTNFESPAVEAEPKKPRVDDSIRIENSDSIFMPPAAEEPESFAETARKSGLAYAAAITLFGAIVFMMIIGWFADLLLGSSPWGIVGGIILGALIGFVQFFRLTAQIFKK